jgi:hypothetical protein
MLFGRDVAKYEIIFEFRMITNCCITGQLSFEILIIFYRVVGGMAIATMPI